MFRIWLSLIKSIIQAKPKQTRTINLHASTFDHYAKSNGGKCKFIQIPKAKNRTTRKSHLCRNSIDTVWTYFHNSVPWVEMFSKRFATLDRLEIGILVLMRIRRMTSLPTDHGNDITFCCVCQFSTICLQRWWNTCKIYGRAIIESIADE